MPREPKLALADILEAISRIQSYTAAMGFRQFAADRKTQDAVIRNLEVIGEAARALPVALREAAPEIEWRKVIAFRNVLTHEYFDVSLAILWDVTANKLAALATAVKRLATATP